VSADTELLAAVEDPPQAAMMSGRPSKAAATMTPSIRRFKGAPFDRRRIMPPTVDS
jgi:hypothetical protein